MTKDVLDELLAMLSASNAREQAHSDGKISDVLGAVRKGKRKPISAPPVTPPDEVSLLNPPEGPSDTLAALTWGPLSLSINREDQVVEVKAKAAHAGRMFLLGWSHSSEKLARLKVTKPSPFHRTFQAALALGEPEARARAFIGLAARLSTGGVPIKETVLHHAEISARRAAPERREELFALIDSARAGSAGQSPVVPAAEPDYQEGGFRGRFVVLRATGDGMALARISVADFLVAGEGWLPVWHGVVFPADVEVAPSLLLRSLDASLSTDPDCSESWRAWIDRELARNVALRDYALARLGAR